MPRNVYGILVGINDYAHKPLRGCINDAISMHHYLEQLCRQNEAIGNYHPLFLLAPRNDRDREALQEANIKSDALPTRQNLIGAFDHFQKARPGQQDICLFFYSGHGSRQEAPLAFRHLKSRPQLETLVCQDSRQPGGKDLLDKELAYLIWKTTKDRAGIHFLTIMDCCHAGDNTRSTDDSILSREEAPNPRPTPLKDYLGMPAGSIPASPEADNFYYYSPDKQHLYFQEGPHLQLAASQEDESAKERRLDGQRRGIFTYCLLKALRSGGTSLSYQSLISQVQLAVRARIGGQTPVLGSGGGASADTFFLGKHCQTPTEEYLVSRRNGEWLLNAGAVSGMIPSSAETGDTVVKLEDGRAVKVMEVHPSESVLDATVFRQEENEREDYILKATIHTMAAPKIPLRMVFSATAEGKKQQEKLEEKLNKHTPRFFELADGEEALFEIKTLEGAYLLTQPGSEVPVIRRQQQPDAFIACLEHLGRWWSVLEMRKEGENIARSSIQVEVDIIEGRNISRDNLNGLRSGHPFLINPSQVTIRYIDDKQPAIACRIKCLNSAYYVRVLYLSSDYGISQYLNQEVAKGEGQWLRFKIDSQPNSPSFDALPILFEKAYHSWGITKIRDYLKIFISTQAFGDTFREQSPPLKEKKTARSTLEPIDSNYYQKSYEDWMAITIPIDIVRLSQK